MPTKGRSWKVSKPVPYEGVGLCGYGCGQSAKFQMKSGNLCCESHSSRCPIVLARRPQNLLMKNPEYQQSLQKKSLEKTGYATPFENPETRTKAVGTVIGRYGVANPFSVNSVKARIKTTNLKRYGVENPSGNQEIKQKKVNTCKKNFGVTNPTKSPALQSKARQTNLVKYGAPHPMQNRGIAYKALKHGLQRREFQLPSGETVFLSGYEPYILDELLRTGLQESDFDFSLSKFPSFTYTNENGNPSKYIPDFFVPRLRWIIEVKSTYTFTLEKTRNLAKYHACRAAGYQMNFIVRRARGKLLLLTELPPRSGKSPQYNPNAIP